MNSMRLGHCLAHCPHRAVRRECVAQCPAVAAAAARNMRPPVQTACPRPGSPVTPRPPGLRPSRGHDAPGIGRVGGWSPSPGRRREARCKGEGKIKGPARGWPQSLVCTCGGTARHPRVRVPSGGAKAHGYDLRGVPLALGCAGVGKEVVNG